MAESLAYLELAALPSSPFWSRCHTRAVLRQWNMLPETVDKTELLVSELVTNAVKFTGRVPERLRYQDLQGVGRISLTLRYLPGQIVIEVTDSDMNPPVLTEAGLDAESGRGLMLVQALSKEWSYFFPAPGRKTVYCVISTDGPSHVPATEPDGGLHDQ